MKCLLFKEFIEKYILTNEATSNVKTKEILDKLTIHVALPTGKT